MSDGSGSLPDVPNRARGGTGSVVEAAPARARQAGDLPPALTSFVGREREISEVKRLLSERRLVTLCGPGGAGKTRLALAVGRALLEEFEGGVWWMELAAVPEEDLVPQAVAQALGVREAPGLSPTEALAEHLKSEKALLVLDNCEHLVEGCAELADTLLTTCPELKILATSREPLRVAGETSFMVPGLATARSRSPDLCRRAGRLRGGPPLRRASRGGRFELRLDGRERPRSGAAVRRAGRRSAGHRARGGQDEGLERGPDTEEAGGPFSSSYRGKPHGRGAPQDAQGDPRSGATTCSTSPNGSCSAGCRSSSGVSRWRRSRRSGPWRRDGRWICSLVWWTSRSWLPGRKTKASRVTGCLSRSGSSDARSSRRPGSAEVLRRHAGHYLAFAEGAEPELLERIRDCGSDGSGPS